jgi:hypothetical protein
MFRIAEDYDRQAGWAEKTQYLGGTKAYPAKDAASELLGFSSGD